MKKLEVTVGFVITGSFCTFDKTLLSLQKLVDLGAEVIPILSYSAQEINSRFTDAKLFMEKVEEITGNQCLNTIPDVEPIGPNANLDILIIAPCTGNTMAKLCNGITDTPALMAAKAHLRNEKPVLLSMSTNDALGINLKNLGMLMNMKNIYFVPFGQDNYKTKPHSMIAHMDLIPQALEAALRGEQLQPVIISPFS